MTNRNFGAKVMLDSDIDKPPVPVSARQIGPPSPLGLWRDKGGKAMSDGQSDMLEYFNVLFDKFLMILTDYHKYSFYGQNNAGCRDLVLMEEISLKKIQKRFKLMSDQFICLDLKLPRNLALVVLNYRDHEQIPTMEQTLYLLLENNRLCLLNELQRASRYSEQLLIFVGENGQVAENGVQYQNASWQFMDGDQDILLGTAKKRCYKDPFVGQPVVLVAEKHRYRKGCFVLKEVIRISCRQ